MGAVKNSRKNMAYKNNKKTHKKRQKVTRKRPVKKSVKKSRRLDKRGSGLSSTIAQAQQIIAAMNDTVVSRMGVELLSQPIIILSMYLIIKQCYQLKNNDNFISHKEYVIQQYVGNKATRSYDTLPTRENSDPVNSLKNALVKLPEQSEVDANQTKNISIIGDYTLYKACTILAQKILYKMFDVNDKNNNFVKLFELIVTRLFIIAQKDTNTETDLTTIYNDNKDLQELINYLDYNLGSRTKSTSEIMSRGFKGISRRFKSKTDTTDRQSLSVNLHNNVKADLYRLEEIYKTPDSIKNTQISERLMFFSYIVTNSIFNRSSNRKENKVSNTTDEKDENNTSVVGLAPTITPKTDHINQMQGNVNFEESNNHNIAYNARVNKPKNTGNYRRVINKYTDSIKDTQVELYGKEIITNQVSHVLFNIKNNLNSYKEFNKNKANQNGIKYDKSGGGLFDMFRSSASKLKKDNKNYATSELKKTERNKFKLPVETEDHQINSYNQEIMTVTDNIKSYNNKLTKGNCNVLGFDVFRNGIRLKGLQFPGVVPAFFFCLKNKVDYNNIVDMIKLNNTDNKEPLETIRENLTNNNNFLMDVNRASIKGDIANRFTTTKNFKQVIKTSSHKDEWRLALMDQIHQSGILDELDS